MAKGNAHMKNKPKIAVLGGDMRQYAVAKELSKRALNIYAYGLQGDELLGVKVCEDINEAIDGAQAVILPLPASTDSSLLNCPAYKSCDRASLERIVELMQEKAYLLGGRIPQSTVIKAELAGIKVIDYFLSERLQIKNAYITAEAALSIAMNSLDRCIKGSHLCVTGTGRISKLLCELLLRLGAHVSVAARNADSLVYFELMGCKTVQINQGSEQTRWCDEFVSGYDIIFNTVPAWLFDRDFLEKADKDMIIIELASAPGGVDICAARELSTNVVWGASLPGKYAPYSAGELIAECISETLEEVSIL